MDLVRQKELFQILEQKLNGMGINYLLNVGPDGLGRIPTASQEILRKAAQIF